MMALDLEGICVSTGAACSAGTVRDSAVLRALGFSDSICASALRFSLGAANTMDEIERVAELLPALVERARGDGKHG
jgi:cysteine desulfurase